MGYETKLFIVEKNTRTIKNWNTGKEEKFRGEMIDGKEMFYANLIATFDMGKVYAISDEMCTYPETDDFIYAEDGNTQIVYDMYGDRLSEIPLDDAIKIIAKAKKNDNYRRFAPCLACLKALKKEENKWNKIVVLHYGY